MFGRKREEAVVVSKVVKFEEEQEAQSQGHCAWCGDSPDEYGSHQICVFHAEQLLEQVRLRKLQRNS
jgi:hypothetical protein